MRRQAYVLALALITGECSAQKFTGPLAGLTFSGSTTLCGKDLSDANATGVYSWNPHVPQFPQTGEPDNNSKSTLPVQWAVTVAENTGTANASVEWSLWYSTAGANYSDDVELGYDVCAYAIETTTLDFLLRAQDDNGDCLTAMDSDCVSDIKDLANQYAFDAVIDPDTDAVRSNLTSNSIVEVCDIVRLKLLTNFPQSCDIFFNNTIPRNIAGGSLTGYKSSYLDGQCMITDSSSKSKFYNIATYPKYTLDKASTTKIWYDILNDIAMPLLTIFMPTANSEAKSGIIQPVSNLQCVRAYHVNAGSETPPPVPAPTPLYGTSLSGGAIAGIVIGVLVGVALIAGLAFFFWRKRKRSQKSQTVESSGMTDPESPMTSGDDEKDGAAKKEISVEAPDTPLKELSPDNEVAMPGTAILPAELDGIDEPVEKEAPPPPAELSADAGLRRHK